MAVTKDANSIDSLHSYQTGYESPHTEIWVSYWKVLAAVGSVSAAVPHRRSRQPHFWLGLCARVYCLPAGRAQSALPGQLPWRLRLQGIALWRLWVGLQAHPEPQHCIEQSAQTKPIPWLLINVVLRVLRNWVLITSWLHFLFWLQIAVWVG